MSVSELAAELQKNTQAKLVVIEEYPRTKEQLEDFNKQVSELPAHVPEDNADSSKVFPMMAVNKLHIVCMLTFPMVSKI